MLSTTITPRGFKFCVTDNSAITDFSEWSNTDDCIYYFPLATLVDNGNAMVEQGQCIVPFEHIYLLDQEERAILGVPKPYDKSLRLRGDGLLNASDFCYRIELLSHVPDGELIPYSRKGNVVVCNSRSYLLREEEYRLFHAVDAFNALQETEKTFENNFRNFAEIKQLALNAHCVLDSYLDNEEVFAPNTVKLEVGRDEQGIYLRPNIEIEHSERFTEAFERNRRIPNYYSLQDDEGRRTRVVLNKKQKEGLQPIKMRKCRFADQIEFQEVLDQPTAYFDPEQFDLSEFYSERVVEIGLYKPKFFPFVSPYKSCWIAGANVETPQNGTTRIEIHNKEELEELRHQIEVARNEKRTLVSFQDTSLDIEDATYLEQVARRQLASPQSPVKETKKDGNKVLIIKDNGDELDFSVHRQELHQDGHYTLHEDPFLDKAFSLKEHQKEGVAWLQYLYHYKASGCLMADDMGLGKTLQILYFIDWHSRTYPQHKPYLIVAPISLLENWECEYRRFFKEPRLEIVRLTAGDIPREFSKQVIDHMQQCDIILTNYESLRNAQLNFCAVQFDIIAMDEAQKIKSPGTLVTNAAKALKGNFKIAMTGTPVENTLLDLWCIMDFCVPGLLGNAKAFATKFQNSLKNEDVDLVKLGNEIHELLGIYFMRRLKSDVAKDLPKKIELKKEVNMPQTQEVSYQQVIEAYNQGIEPNMLVTIMHIREVSEHPYLYDGTISAHDCQELIANAARLQATIAFIDDIQQKEEKAIIFAERKETQKMLQRVFYTRYGIACKIINGDSPTIGKGHGWNRESRQESINKFQSSAGFNLIIMSPVAAGMGLNVTAANHVIHYSRHWNPAKENQATDRAYRIGQDKDVYVYYPMAVSNHFRTFDQTLDELLCRKTTLATSTIFPTERIEVKPEDFEQLLKGN